MPCGKHKRHVPNCRACITAAAPFGTRSVRTCWECSTATATASDGLCDRCRAREERADA